MDNSIRVPQHLLHLLQKAKTLLLKIKIVVSRKSFTLNEVVSTGDFQGCLEYPRINEESAYGTLIVAGWLFSKTSRIEALMLVRDYLLEEQIIYGLERPDVSQAFIDVPGAGSSGFRWHIALEPNYSGNVDIQLWAILKNGERVCCFTRRFKVHASIPHKRRMLNLCLFFRGAAVKALVDFKQGRLPLSPLLWIRYLHRYYRQIQADQSVAIYSNLIHPWQMQDPYQRWIETNHLTPKLLSLMTEDAKRLKTKGVKISIVVPIYNPPKQLLREMITSVTSQIYPNWELCLADDASSKAHVREVLEQAVAEDARIKVIRPEQDYIVEATNSALDIATGEYVAFLDQDDMLSPDALLHIAECISNNPDVDWIYTDEDKIDQTGRRFEPQMKGAWSPEMAITHNFTHHLTVIRKTLVDRVGRMRKGFEGAQDLDLFIRVSEYTAPDRVQHIPHVCYHWRTHPNENKKFIDKYQKRDTFLNKNLDINSMCMAINPHHFCHVDRTANLRLKILIVTHNLNLEGAPLIVYNYAKYFLTEGQFQLSVLSGQDGLLREKYENLNIPVQIVETPLPLVGEELYQFNSRLKSLGESINLASFDLVVCNTLVTFWGIELAKIFGLPSIWHIHESTSISKSIKTLFGAASKDFMQCLLHDCLVNASQVVFQAEATRKVFHEFDIRGNFRTIPGGVSIENISNFRKLHTRSELCTKYRIDENHVVITLIGTICERKGQHIFLEAIKELETIYSKSIPSISCVIVGRKADTYSDFLQYQVSKLNLQTVRIFEETKEVYDFFSLSDIFVCASFEESFPRVILEAMAFKLKIVSTNVFGVAEMISNGYEGYLVEPGNPKALAAKIWQCLADSELSDRLASNACAKACRMFDNKVLLHKHLLLTKEVVTKYKGTSSELENNPLYSRQRKSSNNAVAKPVLPSIALVPTRMLANQKRHR